MPRSTQVPTVPISVSDTGLSPSLVWLSSQLLLPSHGSLPWVLQPRIVETTRFSLFPFRSPLLWKSMFSFFSSGYLDVSVHRVPSVHLWIQCTVTEVSSAGFPHSDICGSQLICSSPQLFAAYHVFLRLLVPRHPPCALLRLTSQRMLRIHWHQNVVMFLNNVLLCFEFINLYTAFLQCT